jgi:hypothetical protein
LSGASSVAVFGRAVTGAPSTVSSTSWPVLEGGAVADFVSSSPDLTISLESVEMATRDGQGVRRKQKFFGSFFKKELLPSLFQ